jgi:hypothetical protein
MSSDVLDTTQVSNQWGATHPDNPVYLGFPPMLFVELALRTAPLPDICAAYNISKDEFKQLMQHPQFIRSYQEAVDNVGKEGVSFKTKAQLISDDALAKLHKLIHDPLTPAAVAVKAIENVTRWAGYEQKGAVEAVAPGSGFQININLGATPASGRPASTSINSTARRIEGDE